MRDADGLSCDSNSDQLRSLRQPDPVGSDAAATKDVDVFAHARAVGRMRRRAARAKETIDEAVF